MAKIKVHSDFVVEGGGSVYLFIPTNEAALEHLQGNVSEEALWLGDGLAVEWRYAADLVNALQTDGFTVS